MWTTVSTPDTEKRWRQSYAKHRQNVGKVKAAIDNTQPFRFPSKRKNRQEAARIEKIKRENKAILDKMSYIMSKPSNVHYVSPWVPKDKKSPPPLHEVVRKLHNEQIMHENLRMLRKMEEIHTKPTLQPWQKPPFKLKPRPKSSDGSRSPNSHGDGMNGGTDGHAHSTSSLENGRRGKLTPLDKKLLSIKKGSARRSPKNSPYAADAGKGFPLEKRKLESMPKGKGKAFALDSDNFLKTGEQMIFRGGRKVDGQLVIATVVEELFPDHTLRFECYNSFDTKTTTCSVPFTNCCQVAAASLLAPSLREELAEMMLRHLKWAADGSELIWSEEEVLEVQDEVEEAPIEDKGGQSAPEAERVHSVDKGTDEHSPDRDHGAETKRDSSAEKGSRAEKGAGTKTEQETADTKHQDGEETATTEAAPAPEGENDVATPVKDGETADSDKSGDEAAEEPTKETAASEEKESREEPAAKEGEENKRKNAEEQDTDDYEDDYQPESDARASEMASQATPKQSTTASRLQEGHTDGIEEREEETEAPEKTVDAPPVDAKSSEEKAEEEGEAADTAASALDEIDKLSADDMEEI